MEINPQKIAKEAYNGAAKSLEQAGNKVQAGGDQALDRAKAIESTIASRYDDLKEMASESYDTAVTAVKKYPLYAVAGSAAIGLLAGLLISRRKN